MTCCNTYFTRFVAGVALLAQAWAAPAWDAMRECGAGRGLSHFYFLNMFVEYVVRRQNAINAFPERYGHPRRPGAALIARGQALR